MNATLETALNHDTRIVLVWPGEADSVALIHALATLERNAIGDKRGLRALAYPTTRLSFNALFQTLIDRDRLLEWARHYLTVSIGKESPIAGRDDQNKDMMLMAVQSARNAAPESDYPMLAEVLPHFEWNRVEETWGHYGDKFLRRSRRALERSHKRALFTTKDHGRITKLGTPATSPDALFGISHLATPRERRAALKSKALRTPGGQPELVIFDLTRAIRLRTDKYLPRLIPEIIKEVSESWPGPCGFLVVTDDPKSFFSLRKALANPAAPARAGLAAAQTLVTGSHTSGFSGTPLPRDWTPPTVSLKYFPVAVVDQEATGAALKFWTLSERLEHDSEAHSACRDTASYLLRLANLPGGYDDYATWMTSQAFAEAVRTDLSWAGVAYRLQGLVDGGAFGPHVEDLRRALKQGTKILEAYANATPLALRLAKEIGACASKTKAMIAVFFRFNADIPIARAFLDRYTHYPNGRAFADFQDRVRFHNHRELPDLVTGTKAPTQCVFVGLPDDTLKLLVSSEDIPADSAVLVDYRRASDVLVGLRALQTVDTYKPYRGRIAGLATELERRISELPSAIDVEKLDRMRVPRLSLSAVASDASRRSDLPGGWRLELEGGRRLYARTKVYVYDPEEAQPFRQEDVEQIKPGDLVFVMSDPLKDLFESCLAEAGHPVMRGANLADVVRSYHRLILQQATNLFGALKILPLARQIQQRMATLDPTNDVSLSRIRYWIDVADSEAPTEDRKPHSTWQKKDFALFAAALEVPPNLIDYYWMMVTGQRRALQEAGRELADRYSRILFSEETAEVVYRLPREVILRLQREAVQDVRRVTNVIPSPTRQ